MCRILGMCFGGHPEDLEPQEIAAILFPALVRQGPHAYGFMQNVNDTITYNKWPGRSDTREANTNILNSIEPEANWVVGHTRWATHGDPADVLNDHPIPHGRIIGVHNGVLTNHEEILAVTGREDEKTKVDSEAIFAAVNKWGHVKGLRRVKGAMVAVYANVNQPHTLYIGRSSGRQLTIGFTDRGNIIFASDKEALLRLEPEIGFLRFSTVSENRLLKLRGGAIIERRYFREPPKSTPMSLSDGYFGVGSLVQHPRLPLPERKEAARVVGNHFRYPPGRDGAIAEYFNQRRMVEENRARRGKGDKK